MPKVMVDNDSLVPEPYIQNVITKDIGFQQNSQEHNKKSLLTVKTYTITLTIAILSTLAWQA